ADSKTFPALFACLPAFDQNFFRQGYGHAVLDRKFRGDRKFFGQLRDFAHRFVQQQRDDSAVRESRSTAVSRAQHELSARLTFVDMQVERKTHSRFIRPATTKTVI